MRSKTLREALAVSSDGRVPPAVHIYVLVVACAGILALGHAYRELVHTPPDLGWLALAALTWVGGAFAIKIPSTSATISVSEVFVFSLAILHGGPAATVTVAVDGLLSSLYRGNRAPRRLLFNIFEPAVSTGLACYLYSRVGGIPPLSLAPAPLTSLVIPVFVLASSYLLMNTSLTAGAIALESDTSIFDTWRKHVVWLSVNFLAGASIALLLAVNMRTVSVEGLLLILPLVFLLYLVFRTWTERVREANVHVHTIDRLYLSTVEALAIAIESKDQVTSNHVRRVQSLSLAIARYLGVSNEVELRAIEAGALLHDIGKVAIPDDLLNKPGQLTPDEYELIKLHAPIGAEILTAVDFPYPVVPIVRHHHENWDGTGYPDGVKGEAIPIGARIISVVDCFDALTSDRPYRRALSDEAALEIIRERTGSMYAQPVVDALIACYLDVRAKTPPHEFHDVSALMARVNQRPVALGSAGPAAAVGQDDPTNAAALDELWSALQSSAATAEGRARLGVPAIAALLRTLTPACTVCVGRVNGTTQSIEWAHVFGHGEQLLRHVRIPLGDGITGWVAANRTTIINSDPALDAPEQTQVLSPRPTAALAVPLGAQGVLTLYTDRPGGFDERHRVVVERAALRLNGLLTPAAGATSSVAAATGPSERPPNTHDDLLALLTASGPTEGSCGVLSIASAEADASHGASVIELAALVLPTVRLSDGVIASAHDEVIAVLPGCEPEAESLIVARLQEALDASRDVAGELTVGFAVASRRDGPDFAAGLQLARARRRPMRRRKATERLEVLVGGDRRRA